MLIYYERAQNISYYQDDVFWANLVSITHKQYQLN